MKKFFLVAIAMFLGIVVSAQDSNSAATFGFNKDIVLEEGNDFVRMIGGDADGFYALRIDANDNLWLEFFNSTSLIRQTSSQIILPMVEGNPSEYVEAFYVDGQIILFTQVVDNIKKEKSLYIQHLGRSGQVINEPKIIGKLVNQNMVVDFNVKVTPNGQNVFVWYNRPFQTYNEEPFYFKMYNADLREIYNKQIKLPLNGQSFSIDQIEVAPSGNVYMLARISPNASQLKKMKTITYTYKMLMFNAKDDEVAALEVKGKKNVLVDPIFGVDENENVDVYGFLVPKGKTNYMGIYHQKIDTQNKSFINGDSKKADYVFSKVEQNDFRADRLMDIYDQMYDYNFLNVLYLSNGGSVVVAEHRNYWSDSIVVPGSKEVLRNEYYKFNDVLVAYCGPNNSMEWMTRIPKSQYSYNDFGKYSSVASYAIGEKVYLFYNDNSKNLPLLVSGETKANLDGSLYKAINSPDRKGFAIAVSIFSDGTVNGSALFPKNNKKCKIIPELFAEYNGRHYMFTRNSKKAKFAMFIGE